MAVKKTTKKKAEPPSTGGVGRSSSSAAELQLGPRGKLKTTSKARDNKPLPHGRGSETPGRGAETQLRGAIAQEPLMLYAQRAPEIARREMTAYAERVSAEVAASRRFNCLITSDAELQRMNREFRGKDVATDVLSFPAYDAGEELGPEIGDIAISIDRARAQAAEHGHDTATEVRILLLHGVLHLLGHDHETDRGAMRRLETRWRTKLDLPAGLIERAKSASGQRAAKGASTKNAAPQNTRSQSNAGKAAAGKTKTVKGAASKQASRKRASSRGRR